MSYNDVWNGIKSITFSEYELFGKKVLFTELRINPGSVPNGFYRYEVRHRVDDAFNPVALERSVLFNFFGTVITNEQIQLNEIGYKRKNYTPINSDKDWWYTGIRTKLCDWKGSKPACGYPLTELTREAFEKWNPAYHADDSKGDQE